MTMLNISTLRSFRIVFPSNNLLESYYYTTKDVLDVKALLDTKNQNLRKTRDLLLPKLISGRLDVEDLDIAV